MRQNHLCAFGVFAAVAFIATGAPKFSATATPAPEFSLAPIAVELCVAETQGDTNPNLKVGISFRDVADVEATTVRFNVLLLDDTNHILDTRLVAMEGHFAPNVLISPRRSPLTEGLLTQPEYPDSSAWTVPDHFGSGVARVQCEPASAVFKDGTTWKNEI